MRRLLSFLAFLALAAVGFAVLRWAIGDDATWRNAQSAGPRSRGTTGPGEQRPPPPRPGEGIPVHGSGVSATVRINGGFRTHHVRPLADGSFRTVYSLQCEHCEPVDELRHRLQQVRVGLFDQNEHVADLTAATAFVELQRDASNRISLAADKEIELRDAVLTTAAGSRLAPLRLVLQVVRAQVRDDELVLHTPGERDPVELDVGGNRPLRLRGFGLQGRLLRDQRGNLQRFDLEILHDPDLRAEGIHLWAKGRLAYVEDPGSGTAVVTLDDTVRVELTGRPGMLPGDPDGQDTVLVTGDRLTAALLRTGRVRRAAAARGTDPGGFRWRHVQLDGGPATAKGRGIDLASPRLVALPGPEGLPWLFSATGGDSRLVQTAADGKGGTSFAARRRIHHIRAGDLVGATLRQFGFPGLGVRPLDDLEIAVLEGSVLAIGADGERIATTNGLHVLRPDPRARDTAFRARGFGEVALQQPAKGQDPALDVRGNDGFALVRTPQQTVFDLGPREPSPDHAFDVRRGDLHLHGHGAARVTAIGADQRQLRIRSPQGDLGGTVGKLAGDLQAIRRLDADFAGQQVRSFEAEGASTTATLQRGDERITVSAPLWRQIAANTWQLRSSGDTLARARRVTTDAGGAELSSIDLVAPVVDLYRLGGRDVVIVATADEQHRARVLASSTIAEGNQVAGTADLAADRIRLLPFAVATASLDVHGSALGPGLRPLLDRTLRQPWLLANGRVVADLQDAQHGAAHGEGATFVGSLGGESCLLIGEPATAAMATITRVEPSGRTMVAKGPRLRFWRGDGVRLSALVTFPGSSAAQPIEVTIRDPGAREDSPLAHVRSVCSGAIDVLPAAVLFHGPVAMRGLDAAGREAPDGLRLSANELSLPRSLATGAIDGAHAVGGVDLEWADWRARSDELVLDLQNNRCSVFGQRGAEIEMRGLKYRASRLEADYANYTVRSFRGSLWPAGVAPMPPSR